jgi:hypothetical protein
VMSRDGENVSELSRVDRLEVEIGQVAASVEDVRNLLESNLGEIGDFIRSMIQYVDSRLSTSSTYSTTIPPTSTMFGRKPGNSRIYSHKAVIQPEFLRANQQDRTSHDLLWNHSMTAGSEYSDA